MIGSRSSVSLRPFGAIAQLAERFHGMEEVKGSIPFSSTKKPQVTSLGFSRFRNKLGRVSNGVSNGNGQKFGSQLRVGSFLMNRGEGRSTCPDWERLGWPSHSSASGHSLPWLRCLSPNRHRSRGCVMDQRLLGALRQWPSIRSHGTRPRRLAQIRRHCSRCRRSLMRRCDHQRG